MTGETVFMAIILIVFAIGGTILILRTCSWENNTCACSGGAGCTGGCGGDGDGGDGD